MGHIARKSLDRTSLDRKPYRKPKGDATLRLSDDADRIIPSSSFSAFSPRHFPALRSRHRLLQRPST